jgi:hypothetical protein
MKYYIMYVGTYMKNKIFPVENSLPNYIKGHGPNYKCKKALSVLSPTSEWKWKVVSGQKAVCKNVVTQAAEQALKRRELLLYDIRFSAHSFVRLRFCAHQKNTRVARFF